MTYDKLLYSLDEHGVARIALNDPATLNALTESMGLELVDALERAAREASAVVLTGEGKAFCSGANLSDATAILDDPKRDVGALLEGAINPALLVMRGMEQPVVTAVRGVAAGVGAGLAMAGDVVLMANDASLFFAFRHVGLVPDGGVSYLLSRTVGRVRAMDLMLLGGRLSAETALAWGVATRIVPDPELDAAALAIARDLAQGPMALGLIKRMAWAALDVDFEAALDTERSFQTEAGRSADFVEGVTAFAEKRPPRFSRR
jgi:2-(1,2-epoxy-1,2-dihydrophenyl)acetyl-CoA isomerase